MSVSRYEIILKQSVGTEDLFLGLSGKNPSSMCCEAMLVTDDYKIYDVYTTKKKKYISCLNYCINNNNNKKGDKIQGKNFLLQNPTSFKYFKLQKRVTLSVKC